MSDYADSSKAALWLDGDGFRGPVNMAVPADPFANPVPGMEAFGGIKAGFTITTEQETNTLDIWNNTSGAPYFTSKKPPVVTVKMRPVDYSKATVLTLLRGGKIVESATGSGVFAWDPGLDEEFSLLMRVVSGSKQEAFYISRATLVNVPEEVLNNDDIAGWDLEVNPLAPADAAVRSVLRMTNWNPLEASGMKGAPKLDVNPDLSDPQKLTAKAKVTHPKVATLDWGDGSAVVTVSANDATEKQHKYTSKGAKTVTAADKADASLKTVKKVTVEGTAQAPEAPQLATGLDNSDVDKLTATATVTHAKAATLDWGDGSAPVDVAANDTAAKKHKYAAKGEKTVTAADKADPTLKTVEHVTVPGTGQAATAPQLVVGLDSSDTTQMTATATVTHDKASTLDWGDGSAKVEVPANDADEKTHKYTSKGEKTITAADKAAATAKTVKKVTVGVVAVVEPATATIKVDGVQQLTAKVNGQEVPAAQVTWASADDTVAAVSNAGLVTGKKIGGPVNINATGQGLSAHSAITVIAK